MNESGPLRGNRGKCPTIRAFFLLLFFSFLNSACMDEREIYLFIYLFLSSSKLTRYYAIVRATRTRGLRLEGWFWLMRRIRFDSLENFEKCFFFFFFALIDSTRSRKFKEAKRREVEEIERSYRICIFLFWNVAFAFAALTLIDYLLHDSINI